MAVKTFTSATLSSSDTNTYLANSGLVYITSQTIGSAVSTVTVSNCFSSTYDNYRITIGGYVTSGATDLRFKLGTTATGYYGVYNYQAYAGTSAILYVNNGADSYIGGSNTIAGENDSVFDVLSPNLATRSTWHGQAFGNGYYFNFGYELANTTQYTGFMLALGTGTLTGGTITVHGYRKA